MDKLDRAVADHLEWRMLDPPRLATMIDQLLERREEWNERRRGHIAELRKRAAEAEAKLKRLYEAIENGVVDVADPSPKDRIAELTSIRDQAQADAARDGRRGAPWAGDHAGQLAPVRACGAPQTAERRRNLSAGPFACPRAAHRSGRPERDSHHGLENRTAADTCRRCERRIGGRWRSQFYTEVAPQRR
jgi:hypothetical protein